jgi:hypothetical protein
VDTLIDGNMFWNVRVSSFVSTFSPEKLFSTSSGDVSYLHAQKMANQMTPSILWPFQ